MSEFKNYTGYMVAPEVAVSWLGYFKDGIYQYSTSDTKDSNSWHVADKNDKPAQVLDFEKPASKDFIEKSLKREYIRRGFKKGVEFKPHNSLMVYKIASDDIEFGYESNKNCLHVIGNYGLIMENGNWAEIIE